MIYVIKSLEKLGYAVDRKGIYDIIHQSDSNIKNVNISFEDNRVSYLRGSNKVELELVKLEKFVPGYANEEWKVIPNTSGKYMVSNMARVKRVAQPQVGKDEKILNITQIGRGMDPVVTIGFVHGFRSIQLHLIVARVFLGEPNGRYVIRKDGNRDNAILENLEYCDKRQFIRNIHSGQRNSNAIFTNERVKEIREYYANNEMTINQLAEHYGITWYQARRIIRGESYLDAGGPTFPGNKYTQLTDEQVRNLYREGKHRKLTYSELAKKYCISKGTVQNIMHGTTRASATKNLRG